MKAVNKMRQVNDQVVPSEPVVKMQYSKPRGPLNIGKLISKMPTTPKFLREALGIDARCQDPNMFVLDPDAVDRAKLRAI